MSDILEKIIAVKRQELAAAQQKTSFSSMQRDAERQPQTRGFIAALQQKIAQGQAAVIAEIKKASPSKGVICTDFDPVAIAQSYAQGDGKTTAACLSVLTDQQFFQGCNDYLKQARNSCQLPVLRKDFMIDPWQIYESRTLGADCILLIAACLDDTLMRTLAETAYALNMDVLIEVHDLHELERAQKLVAEKNSAKSTLIGINNRNLRTFGCNIETTLTMLPHIAHDQLLVTESGIASRDDVKTMRANGVNTFLIGETLMRASSPGLALAELFA